MLVPPTSKAISQATSNGVTGYICGQISTDLAGVPIRDSIQEQTRRALGYIGKILSEMERGYDDLLMCHVFLTDLADFDDFARTYEEFFGENPPARITVKAEIWGGLEWKSPR